MPEPGEERVAAARAQHLLGGPQCMATSRGLHQRKLRKIDARRSERRRVRQVRGSEPEDALAGPGKRTKSRHEEPELAHAFAVGQELGERTGGPAAPGEFIIKRRITG